jgi:hypothetical protein
VEKWEASNTPTIRRLNPSCRHQLSRIAPEEPTRMIVVRTIINLFDTIILLLMASFDDLDSFEMTRDLIRGRLALA